MRKTKAKKRPLLPDPKFNDQLVTRFVNNLMIDGKKSIAFRIFYDALDIVETKKEDKKEEVAKSSDSSDIKKIDEVISQVMDKKNPDYLLKFNSEELALIRNTLYARRGLKYTKGKYKTYFESKSWYKPSVTSGKDLLPEKEERLVEIIRKYEKKAKK